MSLLTRNLVDFYLVNSLKCVDRIDDIKCSPDSAYIMCLIKLKSSLEVENVQFFYLLGFFTRRRELLSY